MKKNLKKTGIILILQVLLLPFYAANFKASKAEFIPSVTEDDSMANPNGVFPVKLSWQDDSSAYRISVYKKTSDTFEKLAELKSGTSEYIHIDSEAVPEQTFTYRLECLDSAGKTISELTDTGWGALTAKQFLTTYSTQLDRTQKRLTLMNKKNILEKIGNEEIEGIMSGTLSYQTKIVGLSGLITVHYVNYQDFDDWHFDGEVQTKSNIAANGTMKGAVNCSGIYEAQIIYDHALLRNAVPGGGYYTVKRKGFSSEDVDHKYYVVVAVSGN